MNRFLLLIFLIYSLILAGLAGLNGGLMVLAIPLIIYVAAGLFYRPENEYLITTRSISATQIWPGEPVEVIVTVTNEGPGLEDLHLRDQLPAGLNLMGGETKVVTSLRTGQTVQLRYTVSGSRGAYYFAPLQATLRDGLNLFQREESLSAPGQFLILPEVLKLRRVELRPRQTRVYAGQIPTRQGGPGLEFFGVREYQPGDRLRWVNQRATAHHEHLTFVNEFQQERMADIGLILDARGQSNVITPTGSLFEHGVQAATALATTLLQANNRVGLFIYGKTLDWSYPGTGKVQRQRLLAALARAIPSDSEVFATLDHLPTRLFPARSQLIFVSPLLPEDVMVLTRLRARGYHLLVISPDPIAFERSSLPTSGAVQLATRLAQLERTLLLGHLRQAAIRVLDWPVEIPFEQAAQAGLSQVRPS